MKIETVAIDSLSLDSANARKHTQKNMTAIEKSLKRFGQRKPIVVRKNIVIAGNGTLAAASKLGWKSIDIVRADDLSAIDARAFGLADNRTSELAEWDMDILGSMLHDFREQGFCLDDIGFDVSYLDEFLKEENTDDTDADNEQEIFTLTVSLENESAHRGLFVELRDRGFKVKS